MLTFCLMGTAAEAGRSPAARSMPNAATVKAEAARILANSKYAHHMSFREWLLSKLAAWRLPHMSSGFARVLLWIVAIWCILSLLAILGHIIWTLYKLLAGGRRSSAEPDTSFESVRQKSFEELRQLGQQLSAEGRFREALGMIMLALLRRLDDFRVIQFHQSKTNGEYMREYPASVPCRDDFCQFVLSFDSEVYGGASCGQATFQRMNSLFEQIARDACKKS